MAAQRTSSPGRRGGRKPYPSNTGLPSFSSPQGEKEKPFGPRGPKGKKGNPSFTLRKGKPLPHRIMEQAGDGVRVEERRPHCPHYPACHGCPFVRFPYRQQLDKKRGSVVNALAASPALATLDVPPLIPSPWQFGYRTRVKLALCRLGSKDLIGLYV